MAVSLLPAASALCLLFLGVVLGQQAWSNFNCPAPRSPKNGLSFIFQQGKEVHFKCHPGFVLVGSPVAKCLNNLWDSSVPDCVPDKSDNSTGKDVSEGSQTGGTSSSARSLFSWDNPNNSQVPSESGMVTGSRRLPLINGLWKSNSEQGDKVYEHPNSAGWSPGTASHSANKTRALYSQELGIAEVRQRQQEEMLSNSILRGSDNFPRGPSSRDRSRQHNTEAADRRRWRIVQARQSPDVLYAGSRAASAHRGENDDTDLDMEGSVMGMFNWAEAPRTPSEVGVPPPPLISTMHRSELSNDELIEMRQRQIAEALLNQMAANLPRGRNSDKAGLIEDARRRQYEELQLLRSSSDLQKPIYRHTESLISNERSNNHQLLPHFRRESNMASDDHLLASGAEVHKRITNANADQSSEILKPVFEEQTHIFKPSYYEDDELSSADIENTYHSRGDTGFLSERSTERPEILEFAGQYSSRGSDHPDTAYRLHSAPSGQRAVFSDEKAAQVEATIRHFLRLRPQVIVYSQPQPTYVPTYHSNLVPKTTARPKPTFKPTRRPDYRPPTRAPVMEANGDKAAQTEEAIYQQYLQAEHLRRILEYERERLEWERRQEWERRNILAEERQAQSDRRSLMDDEESQSENLVNEVIQKPEDEVFFSNTSDADLDYANRVAVLASVDREWLSQLSPDLQARYLEEILTSRRKESDESHHAEDFLRRHMDNFGSFNNATFPNVSTRTSASGHVTTIIESKSPASPNGTESSKADLSCLQSRSGRRLFIRAPKVPFAFVYRYESKKHARYPFKPYLVAEYKCRRGYTFALSENNSLFCRRMEWVGVKPQCVKAG